MTYILNPKGQSHADEAMQPYDELRMILRGVEKALEAFHAKHASAIKLHEDLRDAYESIKGGCEDAEGNIFDIELKREALEEALVTEQGFRERSVDD